MAKKTTVQKPRKKKEPLKEQLELARADSAVLTQKLADLERRLDESTRSTAQEGLHLSQKLADIEQRLNEAGKSAAHESSRMTKTLTEFNVRLSSVAANVLAVSAVAERAAEMAGRSEKKSSLWDNHDVVLKK
jgi:hypothetical protein